jgi:hypothetical protein
MNKQRRKDIQTVLTKLYEIQEELQDITAQEEEALENLPENLQYSERGQAMQESIYELNETLDSIEDIIGTLDEICER